jgi:hypothetical protein
MITRKSKIVSNTRNWPYTPEPSPPLSPTSTTIPIREHFSMAESSPHLRPISITSKRDGTFSPSGRPTLDDVLNSRAPSPYTLAAYTAFLSQQHCLETLEFVTEAKKYSNKYYDVAAQFAGMPLNTTSDEGYDLMLDWCRILDIYAKPGAPREINLPAEERDDLIDTPYDPIPPPPEALDPAVRRMYDLMSDSIFIPFCNSVRSSSSIYGGSAFSPPETLDLSHGNPHRRQEPKRRSPPTTIPHKQRHHSPSLPRNNQSSNLTHGLARTSSPRLSMHISHSSAASEAAMSDDSASNYSPSAGDLETLASPPLTPPQSDMPVMSGQSPRVSHSNAQQKSQRSDSGGWKKLGNSIFGRKKK